MRIVDDDIVEDVESFKLVLNIPEKAVKAGALYGEPRIVNVAVEDDDSEFTFSNAHWYGYTLEYHYIGSQGTLKILHYNYQIEIHYN